MSNDAASGLIGFMPAHALKELTPSNEFDFFADWQPPEVVTWSPVTGCNYYPAAGLYSVWTDGGSLTAELVKFGPKKLRIGSYSIHHIGQPPENGDILRVLDLSSVDDARFPRLAPFKFRYYVQTVSPHPVKRQRVWLVGVNSWRVVDEGDKTGGSA